MIEESDPFEEPTKENTLPDVIRDFSIALNHYLDNKSEDDAIKALRKLHESNTFYHTLAELIQTTGDDDEMDKMCYYTHTKKHC